MSTAEAQAPVEFRVIWEAPDHAYRIVARDWPDGCPTSYDVMARHGDAWGWSSRIQDDNARQALYQWLDAQSQSQGQAETMCVVL